MITSVTWQAANNKLNPWWQAQFDEPTKHTVRRTLPIAKKSSESRANSGVASGVDGKGLVFLNRRDPQPLAVAPPGARFPHLVVKALFGDYADIALTNIML